MLDKRRSGRPRTSEENIERVRQAFLRSLIKSIRTAARQLKRPRSTVHKVLHKNLRLYAYKVQIPVNIFHLANVGERQFFQQQKCWQDDGVQSWPRVECTKISFSAHTDKLRFASNEIPDVSISNKIPEFSQH